LEIYRKDIWRLVEYGGRISSRCTKHVPPSVPNISRALQIPWSIKMI
jgi:hypothetical protein